MAMGGYQRKSTLEDIYLKGKLKWVKHIQPDTTFDPVGKWSMVIYLAGEELEKARELQAQGIKNTIKKDDDGWYMTVSRKCSYMMHGKVVARKPPEVFKQNPDGTKEVIQVPIGNGSDGVAKVTLWSSPNFPGKNLRWEALRVDNLIPYNTDRDFPEAEHINDLAKQEAEPLF